MADYKKFGYYQQRLNEKTRIIGLNTQACYNMNWLIYKSRYDPGNQLKWLQNLLEELERDGEVAIILAHIPPSKKDCFYQWSIRYRALMDRFQNVVRF